MPTGSYYVQTLGLALNDLIVYRATGGGAVSSVVITALAHDTPGASPDTFNGAWVYNATTQQQRRARNGGFDPETGEILVDPPWTPPNPTDGIYITRLFPIYSTTFPSDPSYFNITNRGLSMQGMPDELSVPIVPGQQAYSLAAYSWLDRVERFGHPPGADGRTVPVLLEPGPTRLNGIPADWRRPTLRLDGANTYLDIEAPFGPGSTGSMTLRVTRPGDTLINGAESINGVLLEADTALPGVDETITCAKLEAYQLLALRGRSSATGRYADLVAPQLELCQSLRFFDRTQWQVRQQASSVATLAAGAA